METSLHRQLKLLYAADAGQTEVSLDGFRIDAVQDGRLVEIQHGSLAAIRDKIRKLLTRRQVLVVKPIILRKRLMTRSQINGPPKPRLSPKRGSLLDLFNEMVFFTRVFPHANLTIEAVMVEIEEWRRPVSATRQRRRRWRREHEVEDRILTAVHERLQIGTAWDLWRLLPETLPAPFTTADIAQACGVARWHAQRIAYCLREMGVAQAVGKKGNSHVYMVSARRGRRKAAG